MQMKTFFLIIASLILYSCSSSKRTAAPDNRNTAIKSTVIIKKKVPAKVINTKSLSADSVMRFAETFIGVPYKYGGSKPETGFDCSGLIYYVFNSFKVSVPRVSVDYTNAGVEVDIKDSKRGDIILFTGGDEKSGVVGHMGFIVSNKNNRIRFLHSASGQNGGVMISEMNGYFIPRFVKVNRVFKLP